MALKRSPGPFRLVTLGKRLVTPPALRHATPEERAQHKRELATRRKEHLAAMTTGERVLLYTYYGISIPVTLAAPLLTIYGHGTTRTVGLVLLVLAVLLMAVPVGPIINGRVRRREHASSGR
jgi:Flp pilus assembly protein TadB